MEPKYKIGTNVLLMDKSSGKINFIEMKKIFIENRIIDYTMYGVDLGTRIKYVSEGAIASVIVN